MEEEEAIRKQYEALTIEEEASIDVQVPVVVRKKPEFWYAAQIMWDKEANELHFRRALAKLWQPKEGMNIKKLRQRNRYLINFLHNNDYERVWKGTPWTFNNKLIALLPLNIGDDPEIAQINMSPFWIQAFGVPLGYVSTNICEAIGNFVGTYLDTDENNFKVASPLYLRVRVLINLDKPIKRRMKIRVNAGNEVMIQFRYERMPSFV